MLNLNTSNEYFVHFVREYMLRKSKGIGMTKEQFEVKVNNMKADASRYFSSEQLEEAEKLMRKFYTYATNPDVEKKIESGEVTEKYLIGLFCKVPDEQEKTEGKQVEKKNGTDEILGVLRNDNMISEDKAGKKKIRYVSVPNAIENEFHDSNGNYISIQQIGRIIYSHSNNFENDISKYKVTIRDIRGRLSSIEVYSNLRLANMADKNYRSAILEDLFNKANLEKFNYRGYIGEIEKRTAYDDEVNHKVVNGELTHVIDENYVLKYKSEDLTAVALYEELQQEQSTNREKNQLAKGANGSTLLNKQAR